MSGRFPRTSRLRRSDEYERMRRQGRRYASPHFVVQTLSLGAGPPRLGLTVSRKVGGAVVRNRIKRLLREFFRTRPYSFAPGFCLVISARSSAAGLRYIALEQELDRLLADCRRSAAS